MYYYLYFANAQREDSIFRKVSQSINIGIRLSGVLDQMFLCPRIRGRGVCVCNTTQMSGKEIWWLPQDFCEILGIFHVHFCSFLVHFNIHVLFDLSYSWLHRELITKSTNHAYNCTHTFCLSLCYKYVTVIKSSCSSPSPSQVYSLPTLLPYSGTSLL